MTDTQRKPTESAAQCPFCAADVHDARCSVCGAIVRLTSPDEILANQGVDEACLRKAINSITIIDPFERKLRWALAHLNLKEVDQARRHLQKALELQPGNRLLEAFVGMLESKRAPVLALPSILVVDDSATHLMFVTHVLRNEGYQVLSAVDGHEALTKVEGVDMVFLDINMPGIDGYEVCKQIKENMRTAPIPVVMFSGKDGFFDKMRGRMVGATDYIIKPCAPEMLVEMVKKHCPRG